METLFQEMKRYVGFTEEDAALLAGLRPHARPYYPLIADAFYEKIKQHPGAMAVFSGRDQLERLKRTLQDWADRVLSGPHDEEYFQIRSRIGRVHVKIGLQQMYMFTAMNGVRESFRQLVFKELEQDEPRRDAVVSALHKILDLELAIMLETYREDYVSKLYRSEQQAGLKRLAAIGEVAASVAHEIRNPLAGISGAVEVLRDDLPAESPRREVIKEVLAQIRRLDAKVRDLLMYARSIRLQIEPIDPAELIRATRSLLSEEPLMREVRVEVSVPPEVGPHPMDRGRMLEVLVNLMRNAAEAMQGSGEIAISVTRQNGGALTISVEDTGPGVLADRVDEIFTPFVTTRPQGTGLGLAISRKTLVAHGGSLTCEKGARGGARFIALIPPEVPS